MYLCKICENSTTRVYDHKKKITYYRCTNCGFISLENSHMINMVDEKKHYEKHENSLESVGYVKMFEDFIAKSILPLNNINTVLDFGCGYEPVLSHLLMKKGMSVDIYDFYFYPTKVYENKEYELIVSTEVFEHLKKPIEVLTTLTKHTKKDGYITLMTKFPPSNDEEFLRWWYRRDMTHISFFTPKSFEIMAQKVGLKLLKTIDDNIVVFQKC